MLTTIEDLPEDITGFTIHGALTPHDLQEVLMPTIEAHNASGAISLLLVTASDFLGADVGTGISGQHFRRGEPLRFHRIALVTANRAFAQAVQMFALLVHADIRMFGVDDGEEAIAWLRR